MTDLDGLPGNTNGSYAYGINNTGQIVGFSDTSKGNHAVMWHNGVLTDLNSLIGVSGDDSGKWRLIEAYGINDHGQIVGWGKNPEGDDHAFLLTPVPEPEIHALLLVGLGLVGFAVRLRRTAFMGGSGTSPNDGQLPQIPSCMER